MPASRLCSLYSTNLVVEQDSQNIVRAPYFFTVSAVLCFGLFSLEIRSDGRQHRDR